MSVVCFLRLSVLLCVGKSEQNKTKSQRRKLVKEEWQRHFGRRREMGLTRKFMDVKVVNLKVKQGANSGSVVDSLECG